MAVKGGLEPPPHRLTGECATLTLHYNKLVEAQGLEP